MLQSHASRKRRIALACCTPIVIVGLALLAPSGAAVAGDNPTDSKIYNGAHCRAVPGDDFEAEASYEGVTVQNRDTERWLRVLCPIVRDYTIGFAGWEKLKIGYFDRNEGPKKDIRCRAQSRDESGELVDEKIATQSEFTTSGWLHMTANGPVESSIPGSYGIVCEIPPAVKATDPSGIAFYRVQEADDGQGLVQEP